MSIALFSEILGHFPASRAKALHARFGIECVYALVWPDYEAPVHNHPKANREAFNAWRQDAGVPLWAWINCRSDQQADASKIATLDRSFAPDGWLLDIEGEWTKGANLETLCAGAKATGKPERVCHWLFEVMGCEPGDELDDLFPGTGAVTAAWDKWVTQRTLFESPMSNPHTSDLPRSLPESAFPAALEIP